jgi:hypothetical protein
MVPAAMLVALGAWTAGTALVGVAFKSGYLWESRVRIMDALALGESIRQEEVLLTY